MNTKKGNCSHPNSIIFIIPPRTERTLFRFFLSFFSTKRKEKKKPKARSWKEQNYISNAKMMLMQRNHLSEDEAYRYIQKSSMDSGTNMVETAQMLLMLLYDE